MVLNKKHEWETVIGLEIHAQVSSKTKLFSGASTQYGGAPNSQVSLVDAAFPGMLPVLNEFCIEQAVKTGLALNGEINKVSVFDRKHYFYADLPQGYQISQFHKPIVEKGILEIDLPGESVKNININRIHLEQDAGKSFHDQSPEYSFIDLNRCGIALMEIVTDPDFRSAAEVGEFLKKLRSILRYLDTCDGNMEQGSLRCDANVSVRKHGEPFGTRCEIKNLNSIRNVMLAIEHEVERQIDIIENGDKVKQETRLFDVGTGTTRTLRSKEQVEDYRYFPDPDLLPVKISDEYIAKIKATLPELPDHKKHRYIDEFELSRDSAILLSSDRDVACYFEEVAKEVKPKLAANWIVAELFGRLNKAGQTLQECKVTAKQLANLIQQIEKGIISGKIAKEVFDEMFENGTDAEKIIENKGLKQISDPASIEKLVEQVINEHPDKVVQYKSGKDRLFGFFVGQIMKASNGKVNPQLVNEFLKSKLNS
ncbi:MAG: Asp-tRNA(Asn)/Glu-tRNA(Gln) amidotransferase subunit GatB [Rickettsiales bacterium]|nr:Asp-tRNA(Asn)/Glu-tRNA(Gln) amidotransferase subunit GatB [Rickettsiales bacterium]